MSGDETDEPKREHPQTFVVVKAPWQSHALRTFMRSLDLLYRKRWAKPTHVRATSGNPPRTRIDRPDGPSSDNSCVPLGLWRNCYDDEWLQTLSPHQLETLSIINQDYDFGNPLGADVSGEDGEQ